MYQYLIYGLKIRSEFLLPELTRFDSPGVTCSDIPTVTIVRGIVNQSTLSDYFGTRFCVKNADTIVVDTSATADESTLRVFLLQRVLAVVLRQLGRVVLHGSVVADHQDRSIAFVGRKGWGKSTLAALMCENGYRLVADDLVVVEPPIQADEPLSVVPAHGYLKLWPDTLIELGQSLDPLPRVVPTLDKRLLIAKNVVSPQKKYVLKQIYCLFDNDTDPSLMTCFSPQQQVVTLVTHAFAPQLLPQTEQAQHFVACASIVSSQVRVLPFLRPSGLAELKACARRICCGA